MALLGACGGARPSVHSKGALPPSARAVAVRVVPDGPRVSTLTREGDGRLGFAVAVLTAGIDDGRPGDVALALAALVESRLQSTSRAVGEVRVVAGRDGFRVRALVEGRDDLVALTATLATILRDRTEPGTEATKVVARKLAALAKRPLPDPSAPQIAVCGSELHASSRSTGSAEPSEVTAWRDRAFVRDRVVFSVVATKDDVEAAFASLRGAGAWPTSATSAGPAITLDDRTHVSESATDLAPGFVRFTTALTTRDAASALSVATTLGNEASSLGLRVDGVDARLRVTDVSGHALPHGGCVRATIEGGPFTATEVASLVPRAARATRDDLEGTLAGRGDALAHDAIVHALGAPDPGEAAERTAWLALSDTTDAASTWSTFVQLPPPRDPPPKAAGTSAGTSVEEIVRSAAAKLDEAPASLADMDTRGRVERGQGEVWVLVGNPCGVADESASDAGVSALAMLAATLDADTRGHDEVRLEARIDDGIAGILAHAPRRDDETSVSTARRVAEVATTAFLRARSSGDSIARARATLLGESEDPALARIVPVLANALAPLRPSTFAPFGTSTSLSGASDDLVRHRRRAMTRGPLRVAVLATEDDDERRAVAAIVARLASTYVDPGKTCGPEVPPSPDVAGGSTFAVSLPESSAHEAWLAYPVRARDASERAAAETLATALDGEDGLLGRAPAFPGVVARGARVIGSRSSAALVVRVVSENANLDAGVASVDTILASVRDRGLEADDLVRALASRRAAHAKRAIDPRARLDALFRDDAAAFSTYLAPSADDVRSVATRILVDDRRVVVLARPARTPR
ncbi:MAG: hypothetical protein U0169_20125 [Polyangiaceae bacterium]